MRPRNGRANLLAPFFVERWTILLGRALAGRQRLSLFPKLPITLFALECSRWRGGRSACNAHRVMPKVRAFNCGFRFPLILVSRAKSIDYRQKKIQFPYPLDRGLPLPASTATASGHL
jgi:hypothetical protein